ncbi:MAG: hypothetical protein HY810_00020 [Candidatus Omnitrophica bacterium]|nr:hypothetical protein [Candidatus Omnitrophota bacterium]
MKRILFFFLLSLTSLGFVGCGNKVSDETAYQLLQTQDGEIYRLNKKTGQTVIVKGKTLIPVQLTQDPTLNNRSEINHSEAKPAFSSEERISDGKIEQHDNVIVWQEQQLPGKNLKCLLTTYRKKNTLYAALELYPYASLKDILEKKELDVYYQRKWHGITVRLVGKDGNVLKKIKVKLFDMDKKFDEKGRFRSLRSEQILELTADEYADIASYSVEWKLDNILIPNYKFENKMDDLIRTYNCYGEVDRKIDLDAPYGAKYWWITFPDREKVYFSTEEELLKSYEQTTKEIIEKSSKN